MGGKHKVANRTKNNARPASSGRSAELLAATNNQFVLFAANKDSIFEPCLKLSDDIDNTLDPNIQVILKKICKKDSLTKIKGLQELADFIKHSEADEIKPILPVWTKFFNGLATDMDNKVRDATHNTHREIVLKAKRNIAPYLKQLMPAWFTSQYDTYPPAASAASLALKEAFPNNKFQEAIIFCQEDILSYISDNLLVQTSQTLSNMKHVSEDEAEARHERVLISSLQGYCLYLEQATADHIQAQSAVNKEIISNSKYWKLSTHKVSHIRAAWFKVLIIICQKAQFLLQENESKITIRVFGALDEKDPVVLPCVWEALLLIMSYINEWWKYVNIEKVFYPKLWKLLKHGGEGNSSIIYPSLLPLISRLPPSVEADATQFYNTFFDNFRTGLYKKSAVANKSESVSIITALIECFQYVVLKRQNELIFCKSLIKNHLLSLVEWCLVEEQTGYKTMFNQITLLIHYWLRNAEQSESFGAYVDFFFEELGDLFEETLFNLKDRETHDIGILSNKQVELLQSLKHSAKLKKSVKVKFVTDEKPRHVESTDSLDTSIVEPHMKYHDNLSILAHRLCLDYVKYIEEKQCKVLIEHLFSLVADFNPEIFFEKMFEKMKLMNPDSKMILIYVDVLYKWMKSELKTKYVVDLSFLLFRYVGTDDKRVILESLSTISDDDCVSWFILEALAHPNNKEPIIRNWLQNDKVGNFIVSILDKEIHDISSPELSVLLKLALTENEDGELYVNRKVVSEIIEKLIDTLEHYRDYPTTIDTCASLAAYTSALVYTSNQLLAFGDQLLQALFRLSCTSSAYNDMLSAETLYEVNSAWQDALSILIKNLSKEDSMKVAAKLTDIVETELLRIELSESQINHIVSVVVNYLRAIYEGAPMALTEYMELLDKPSMKQWQFEVYNMCRISDYVKGHLSSPYEEIEIISQDNIEKHAARMFAWVYLKICVFITNLEEEDYPVDEDEEEIDSSNILKVLDNRALLIAHIIHDLTLANSFLETFKNSKYYDTNLTFFVLIEDKLKSSIESFDSEIRDELKSIVKEKSLTEAWFWTKASYYLYTEIIQQSPLTVYEEFIHDAGEDKKLGVLHLTQVFKKHLNYDYVQYKFDPIGAIIVLNCLIHCDEIDVQIAEVFSKVEAIRSENVPRFLFESSNINWIQAQEITEIVRLCSSLMRFKFSNLSQRHWDFCVICLVSWASNSLKNRSSYEKYQFQALLSAIATLYVNTDNHIRQMQLQNMKNSYIDEWRDVLVESIHGDLAQVWLYLSEQLESKQTTIHYLPFIQEFSKIIANINPDFIFKINDTSLPKWTKFLRRSCSLLLNRQPSLQLWGYKMLLMHIPGLVKIDSEAVSMNTPHKKGLIFEQFKEKLVETHEIVNSLLLGFKIGEDSCRVEPNTDSFTYTFAYLLLWDILLTLCQQASSELRFQYSDWLRNEDLLKTFLNNIFRLMPSEVLHYSEGKSKSLIEVFQKKPKINVEDTCGCENIEQLVCWLYYLSLSQLPALVRQWWTALDSRVAQTVEKITTIYISQSLCNQELNDVMTYQNNFKNMVIKVMPTAREVIAVYTVDEAQVELVITLPSNYPLGGLDVQCNKQIAGASHKQWLLQFKKCVLHQNGHIWDGLSLWNNNLDRKFDGVEECYICFAVLHPGTCQLPKLSCQTCKKKFHSACLYKWFRTSYKSSCPICRNLF